MPQIVTALAAYFGGIALSQFFGLSLTPATMLAAKVAPPWLVALLGATAAAGCALLDYVWVPRAFRWKALDTVRKHRLYARIERAANVAPFWTTGFVAGLPLPYIVLRVMLPLSGYPRWRFVLATVIGRFCRIFVIATVGVWLEIPTPYLVAMIAGGIVIGVGAMLHQRRKLGLAPATPPAPAPPPTSEA